MRLGYVYYDGLMLLVIYRDPTKSVDILATFTDSSGKQQSQNLETKAALVLVSEPMLLRDFALRAELDDESQGEARGFFSDGSLQLTDRTGVFAKVEPHMVTERETLHALPYGQCAGLGKTEIALLSKKWQGDQMLAYAQNTYWWSDAGLQPMSDIGRRGITGFSSEQGDGAVDCCAALVAVLSGSYTGKTGWLVWSTGNAGVAVSGDDGEMTGAVWYPSALSLPRKTQDVILLPPGSIANRG